MAINIKGLYTAIVTPFTEGNQSVDFDSLERIIEKQVVAGVDGIVVLGSTGESATCSHKERIQIIEATVAMVAGRTHVIAGTGSNSTTEAIELSSQAMNADVDALLLATPYYNKPPQRGLVAHYEAVANAVDIPLILYNIPGRTSVYMEPETIIQLSKHENIVGVKDASSEFDDMKKIIAGANKDFALLSGNDDETLDIMDLGGVGSIAVTSNISPFEMKNMVHHALNGNDVEARRINQQFLGLYDHLFTETNPIPIKALMASSGYCQNEMRLPLVPMDKEKEANLIRTYQKLNFYG